VQVPGQKEVLAHKFAACGAHLFAARFISQQIEQPMAALLGRINEIASLAVDDL
jgi:hypothetical protein